MFRYSVQFFPSFSPPALATIFDTSNNPANKGSSFVEFLYG